MSRFAKIVAVMILVASSVIALHARAPVSRSEVESNDTAATATTLALVGSYGIGAGTIGSAGDIDFWSFTAPAGARVWLLTDTGGTITGTSRDTVVDLIAPDGATVIENDDDDGTGNGGDGTNETGLASTIAGRILVAGGTYFIKVRAFSGTATINPYRLLVAVTTASPTAETEPNDTSATANPIVAVPTIGLQSGTIAASGDIDFYSVSANAGDVILIATDADPERDGTGTDLVVQLISTDGATSLLSIDSSITGSLANPAAETANYIVGTAGTYFVRVRHFSATGTGSYHLLVAAGPSSDVVADVDGERKTDIGVYRGSTGEWFILRSLDGALFQLGWGCTGCLDISVPGDYDGDGKADIAVYRNTTGEWFIRNSSGGSTTLAWGWPPSGDIPVPGDYDGDGKADIAVYRNTTGEWFIRNSSGGSTTLAWGWPPSGDIPVPGDYDGDGKADISVYRNTTGEWFIRHSGGGTTSLGWGFPAAGDIPVQGDYDGDGKVDMAVYRNTTGEWFVRNSGGGTTTVAWGWPAGGDLPVPGDYDGDGKADIAVYRNSTGAWYVRNSGGGTTSVSWGAPALGDIPLSRPSALR